MKISVVIPYHNARDTIAAALQSVAAQTFPPHEIIVVNDGSSDDSVAAARASGVGFRLQSVSVGNAGAARNAGIAAATGDWIALLDADDVWFAGHLEQAAVLLGGGSDVAFMANHCFRREGRDAPLPPDMRHCLTESRAGLSGERWVGMQSEGFHFGHSTVIYRRAHLAEIGGFDESYARQEDLDLWLRAIAGRTWAYGAHEAAAYRTDTPGSLSKNWVLSERLYLRAWLRNRARFSAEASAPIIASSARRAMSLAFVDGTRADFRAARRLARPHLTPTLRFFTRSHPARARYSKARFDSNGCGCGGSRKGQGAGNKEQGRQLRLARFRFTLQPCSLFPAPCPLDEKC